MWSCSQEPTGESRQLDPETANVTACPDNASATLGNMAQFWGCNSTVYLNVQSLSQTDREIIESAAGVWNARLHNGHPQLPFFTTDPLEPRNFTVSVTKNGSSTATWCGAVTPKTGRPTTLVVGTIGTNNQCGAPLYVALHEMAHIVGFYDKWDTVGGLLAHCVVSLKASLTNTVNTNGQLCQWEIEAALALYGARATAPRTDRSFITHLFTPTGPSSLQVPNTATLGYTWYGLGASNGTLCGRTNRQMCEADEVLVSASGSLDWTSSDPTRARVTSPANQTTVTAVAEGTPMITARPRATSTLEVAVDARASRQFTVTPPPPPPPDAQIVGNYTSSTNTIRSSQTCKFMAFPAGATYQWYRMNQGTTIWKGAGTTREISVSTSVTSFQLKLVVTNVSGSDTAFLSLTVTSTGVLCDGY
jgi:hypothetical protein